MTAAWMDKLKDGFAPSAVGMSPMWPAPPSKGTLRRQVERAKRTEQQVRAIVRDELARVDELNQADRERPSLLSKELLEAAQAYALRRTLRPNRAEPAEEPDDGLSTESVRLVQEVGRFGGQRLDGRSDADHLADRIESIAAFLYGPFSLAYCPSMVDRRVVVANVLEAITAADEAGLT